MGLFNFNFAPGPGIDKDAPRRKGIFLYLEIFFRKFFKLLRANVLYFLVSLPFIALIYFLMPAHLFTPTAEQIPSYTEDQILLVSLIFRGFMSMAFLTFIGSGPASAGLAYILRCFTREEPVWLFSEFFDKFKQNFKQSLAVCVISTVCTALMFVAAVSYFEIYSSSQNMMFLLLGYIISVIMLMFMLIHTFIYQIMITYDCKLFELYKNAALLTFAKFPICLIIAIISMVMLYFVSFTFNPFFTAFLYFLVFYSIVRFPLEFYAARTIERIINANEQKNNCHCHCNDCEEEI